MFFLLLMLLGTANDNIIVDIKKYGSVKGIVDREAKVQRFLRIPYTDRPERFTPSGDLTPWVPKILDGTEMGPACLQNYEVGNFSFAMDEDCLHINIWRPLTEPTEPLPVMIFIHGGAFITGSGTFPVYNADWLVANQNVIVITLNYRLGVFGYFSDESLRTPSFNSTGSMNGLYDQITAISFIQEIIPDFWGDKDRITLFGESAGSLSICWLLMSPIAQKRLNFKAVILESGPCIGAWGSSQTYIGELDVSRQFRQGLNATLDKLKTMDASKILSAPGYFAFVGPDGYVMPDTPLNIFSAHAYKKDISVMIGGNTHDGLAFAPYNIHKTLPTDSDSLLQQLSAYFGESDSKELIRLYGGNLPNANVSEIYMQINCEVCITCPNLKLATQMSTESRVWLYKFDLEPAVHGAELPLLFHTPAADGMQVFDWPYDESLANFMGEVWAKFGHSYKAPWSPVHASDTEANYWIFSKKSSPSKGYSTSKCQVIDSLQIPDTFEFCLLSKDTMY